MSLYSSIASSDTRMLGSFPDTASGSATSIGIGSNAFGVQRGLFQWDLSSIPAGSNISSAIISIWLNSVGSNTTRTIRVYRTRRAWTELGCTWNKWDGTNAWTTAGCGSTASDYENTEVGNFTFTTGDLANHRYDIVCSNALIMSLLSGGSFTNNGFLFRSDTESSDLENYMTRENATTAQRPLLTITYTEPAATNTAFLLNLV